MWPIVKAACRWAWLSFWETVKDALESIGTGFLFGIGFWLALAILASFCSKVHAAEVTIPRAAAQYRAELVRSARIVWGLDAPIAVFAAQVHTES